MDKSDGSMIKNNKSIKRHPRQKWLPEVVVIGPGGLKGFMELGALQRLEQRKMLQKVHSYIGVSIGAVISMLHICGFNWLEIRDIGLSVDLFKGWSISNINEMVRGKGLVSHQNVREVLTRSVLMKFPTIPTFSQLFNSTGKNFIAVSYNITRRETYYFSRYSHPTMSVVDAAIASSSIPIVFYRFRYRGEDYTDGALGNPYPINVADDGGTNILGLYISSLPQLVNPDNLAKNISALVHAPITELRNLRIDNASSRCKHIKLISELTDVTGTMVRENERNDMFKSGYKAGEKFINELNDDLIIPPDYSQLIPCISNKTSHHCNNYSKSVKDSFGSLAEINVLDILTDTEKSISPVS